MKSIDETLRDRIGRKQQAADVADAQTERAQGLLIEAVEQLERAIREALATDPSYAGVTVRRDQLVIRPESVRTIVRATARTKIIELELGAALEWGISRGAQLGLGAASPLAGSVKPLQKGVLKGEAEFEYAFSNGVLFAPPRVSIDPATLHLLIAQAAGEL